MTKTTIVIMALSAMAWPSTATTTTKKPLKHRTTHHVAVTPAKGGAAKHKLSKSKPVAQNTRRRSYQASPSPERYKEIQGALASKGYYKGEPTGEWGADSQDALRRFQADQNLTSDGKLSSMSLIALGLGPKRLSAQSRTQTAPEPAKPEVPQ